MIITDWNSNRLQKEKLLNSLNSKLLLLIYSINHLFGLKNNRNGSFLLACCDIRRGCTSFDTTEHKLR